jgi:hypothetical protein
MGRGAYTQPDIFRGPAKIEIDDGTGYVNLGIVGDCRVALEMVDAEETGEQWGTVPHAIFHDGTRVRVTVPMKQTTRENLEDVCRGHGGSGYVYFEDRMGRADTFKLKLTAVQGKSGAGGIDASTNYLELYAVVPRLEGDIAFSRQEERVYETVFESVLDVARPAGRRIGEWNRPNAT